jgi:CubicO group peptidase (beta-lactamase class C family)
MKRIVSLLFFLPGLIIYTSADTQSKQERIDSLISAYYNADCFKGVVLVMEKGETIFKKAYGIADRELNVTMTGDMKFRIASISKPFTAFIILQLVDEGVLRLDGKITDYIPDYKGIKGDIITIELWLCFKKRAII